MLGEQRSAPSIRVFSVFRGCSSSDSGPEISVLSIFLLYRGGASLAPDYRLQTLPSSPASYDVTVQVC